ncbi:hypothetical protein PFISCL1PPCAC_4500, partial [Pristionchus fissidentatus]
RVEQSKLRFGMWALSFLLVSLAVSSLDGALVSREKRSYGFQFKYFKLTKRPTEAPVFEQNVPDTSFIVEKPASTSRPRMTLEEKFASELYRHGGAQSTRPPVFQPPTDPSSSSAWDFL